MRDAGLALAALALLGSCASVQPISGGDPDKKAPALLASVPPNRSTSFTARTIQLEFDERVQLERVRERMLISPPLEETPEVRLAGPRSVEIVLKAPLQPNTTYSFNLGDCVKDLTEGNIAAGLNYVVSTGAELDSAIIFGSVTNAFTGAAEKEMIIGLYAPGDTAAFRSGRPAYMTRCNTLGLFSIGNLPHGRYMPLALHDKNNNYRFDLPNEEIALSDSAISLTPEDTVAPSVALRSFLPASDHQQVRSYSVTADGAFEVVLARAADSLTLRDVARTGGRLYWTTEFNSTRDSVLFWPSDTTLLAEGLYQLRSDLEVLDSLRYRRTRAMPFHTGLQAELVFKATKPCIEIRSSRPLSSIDTSSIILRTDSLDVPFELTHRPNTRSMDLCYTASGSVPLQLLLLPKAVSDIYGGRNDTLRATFGPVANETTGSLSVALAGLQSGSKYLLQLLDAQQRPLLEASLSAVSPKATWDRLAPGLRTLRLIHDQNSNGHWDTGTWRHLQQPERTWYHPEPVNVRAAWDIKVDWDITPP